jgi:hypothetical protein
MKKYLLAIAAIASLWISCTKEKEQDTIIPDTTSRPLLREAYTSFDSVRWEYNADSTPLKYTYNYFYSPNELGMHYTMTYDYSKSNEVTMWKKNVNDANSILFQKIEYANNKIIILTNIQPLVNHRDSFTYKPNGQMEKVYAMDGNRIYMIDSLGWTNGNITKIHRNLLGNPGTPAIMTYTYDDKPNPLRGLIEVTRRAPINSNIPRFYSVNNITSSIWYQPLDGYVEKNIMQLTYTDNKLTRRVTLGSSDNKPMYSKDTVYYLYDKK